MGGQACVFYGAAQVSKDIDFLVLAEPRNFERLEAALADLRAEQAKDHAYWEPLRSELERYQHEQRGG